MTNPGKPTAPGAKQRLKRAITRIRKATKPKKQRGVEIAELPEYQKLKPRYRVFVIEYLANNWNATAAARKAGFGTPRNAGNYLMNHHDIRAAIDASLRASRLSAEQVLGRLSEMATVNLSDFVDTKGVIDAKTFKRRGYLVKTLRAANRTRGTEIELHDAQAALVHVGRGIGLFKEPEADAGKAPTEFVVKVKVEHMP